MGRFGPEIIVSVSIFTLGRAKRAGVGVRGVEPAESRFIQAFGLGCDVWAYVSSEISQSNEPALHYYKHKITTGIS